MKTKPTFDYTLGIPKLIPEWKAFFSSKFLVNDLAAGITVGFVAIPLSLAIALATGVPPVLGLITAIIAGIVCSLFGGGKLTVSGPAAAMSVLLADIVNRFGLGALPIIGICVGVMQLLTGVFGIGKIARFVPLPVIAGFTAGIGFIILVGQLPRAFGITPPPDAHLSSMLVHLSNYFHQINGAALLVVILTFTLIRGIGKVIHFIPPMLPAVVIATILVYLTGINDDVALIGTIPNEWPKMAIPSFGSMSLSDFFINVISVYALASLETLLSASAIDKLTQGKKHNPDQELIGQGLGNIAVSFFGGIPITGVIARSATNVQAGAKTRRSSIFHSILILLTLVAIAPLIGAIPIPVLAAVLFSVAISMMNYHEFKMLLVTSRPEAIIYGVTFVTIVAVDLIEGIQVGMLAAGFIVLLHAAKTHLHISFSRNDSTIRFSITGSLTFLSINKIAKIEERLNKLRNCKNVILDLSAVSNLDTTGAAAIIDLYHQCESKNLNFYIKGLHKRFENYFKMQNADKILDDHYIVTENEFIKKPNGPKSSRARLVHGFYRFYRERKTNHRRLFEYIVDKQDPHTLFITCSDSRMMPSQIISAEPGELFTIRNVGNYVPPYSLDQVYSEAAAIDFVLTSLDITDIVVCGHANCGAMRACCYRQEANLPPKLKEWVNLISHQLNIVDKDKVNTIAKLNVLNQLKNLKTYPLVNKKLEEKKLNIHGWFYDFNNTSMFEWDIKLEEFRPLVKHLAVNS